MIEVLAVVGGVVCLVLFLKTISQKAQANQVNTGLRPSKQKVSTGFNLDAVGLPCRWVAPQLVSLPNGPTEDVPVRSFSFDSDAIYTVNLGAQTCTCPDWVSFRSGEAPGSIGRMCKHLVHVLDQKGTLQNQNELTRWALNEKKLAGHHFLEVQFPHGLVTFAFGPGKEWVELLAPSKDKAGVGVYRTYGYSSSRNRWAGGDGPYKPMEVKGAIKAVLGGRGVI